MLNEIAQEILSALQGKQVPMQRLRNVVGKSHPLLSCAGAQLPRDDPRRGDVHNSRFPRCVLHKVRHTASRRCCQHSCTEQRN